MSHEPLIVAGLDLGTYAVKCVIGLRQEDGTVDILGTGTSPARGFQNGVVCEAEEAVKSIRAAVGEADLMAGTAVEEVFMAVSGRYFDSFQSHGMARITGGTVGREDMLEAISMARCVKLPAETEILHVIAQDYIIDGQSNIARPMGMPGVRLEVHAHCVAGHIPSLMALEEVCDRANLSVVDVVMPSLAQAEAVLTPQAKDMGVVLVDVGGDTTEIAVFDGGAIQHHALLPVGGNHVTHDIKDCLNTPTVEAEHLKQLHGCALADMIGADEVVEVPGVGGRRPRTIKRRVLCDIIEARVGEILRLLKGELDQIGYVDGLPGGLVLTGGTASLPGIVELAEHVMRMPAAKGEPQNLSGLVDVVRSARYATGTGLVLCGVNQKPALWFTSRQIQAEPKGMRRFFRFWGGRKNA
jgi:cell division protein FtsA